MAGHVRQVILPAIFAWGSRIECFSLYAKIKIIWKSNHPYLKRFFYVFLKKEGGGLVIVFDLRLLNFHDRYDFISSKFDKSKNSVTTTVKIPIRDFFLKIDKTHFKIWSTSNLYLSFLINESIIWQMLSSLCSEFIKFHGICKFHKKYAVEFKIVFYTKFRLPVSV